MDYKKRSGYIKIIAVVATLVFVSALVLGVGSSFWRSESKDIKGSYDEIPDEKALLQQKEEAPVEQPGKTDRSDLTVKYMTISQKGNIDIIVNYLNPISGAKDTLEFEVSLGTHSIDLTGYKDIRKYVELRTDAGVVVNEGFEWDVANAENHHISGILKIKNDIRGKPVVGQDTKSFKLVFKNIPDASEREHLYEGEKLK